METKCMWRHRFTRRCVGGGLVFLLVMASACNNNVGNNTTEPDNDDNVLLNDTLGFEGSVSGKIAGEQSTRGATDTSAAQQAPSFDPDDTCVRFRDLVGNPLMDADGQPVGEVPVDSNGNFEADGLPVGVDFTLCGDIGKDGSCDVESCVNIPSENGGPAGRLENAQVDPLTTIILAKLRLLINQRGIDARELPVSPVAVVTRIVEAYTHLFEEAGVEHRLTLDEIDDLATEALASIFDTEVPTGARTGMRIVEGNLDASRAEDANELALAVAEVFLRAGFPIADHPNGPDLSALADKDGVTVTTRAEIFGEFGPFEDEGDLLGELANAFPEDVIDGLNESFPDGLPGDLAEMFPDGLPEDFDINDLPPDLLDSLDDFLPEDFTSDLAGQRIPGAFDDGGTVIYISEFIESDRNFTAEGDGEGSGIPPLPVMTDRVLGEMARLHLAGRRITLADLYDLLTSIDSGLGVRLTYFVHDPNFAGDPLTLFETEDGRGRALDVEQLYVRTLAAAPEDVDLDNLDGFDTNFRSVLRDLLGDTVPPPFTRLFDGFVADRVGTVNELTQRIRNARAHLPFNATGSSSFFVVADGDSFVDDTNVNPVTVDITFGERGFIDTVTYNASGTGAFYLGFTRGTEELGLVEFVLTESGQWLHGDRGPIRVSMYNEDIFQPVNGMPFGDFVTESATRYPTLIVPVFADAGPAINDMPPPPPGGDMSTDMPPVNDPNAMDPIDGNATNDEPIDGDPIDTSARDIPADSQHVPVLATAHGENAQPVRVAYDPTTGTATVNHFGRHLLMLLPDTHETGVFALFNEDVGRPARMIDPSNFFAPPPQEPDDFEDLFNETDDFDDFDRIDDFLGDPMMPDDPTIEDPMMDDPNAGDPMMDDPSTGENTDGENTPTDPSAARELFGFEDLILVPAENIVGLEIRAITFEQVFGTEVPNPRFNADANPYFDDINGNGVEDEDEPTAPYRPTLFDPNDWRATDIRLFYRRTDNGESVSFDNVDFESDTPQTIDGVPLVRRTYLPRLNAFRFGRPNTAINLLTAFLPPDFFDGTKQLNRDTAVDIFSAMAFINLVMDQVFNIEADIDPDGFGPLPRRRMVVEASPFVVPIDDPFVLIVKGFRERTIEAEPMTAGDRQ